MGQLKFLVIFVILSLAACSGQNAFKETEVTNPSSSGDRKPDPEIVVGALAVDPPEVEPIKPELAAPTAPLDGSPVLIAPNFVLPSALRDGLKIAPAPGSEAEAIKGKACFYKYERCQESIGPGEDGVEKQRLCTSTYNSCLAGKTEEEKCEENYQSCLTSGGAGGYSIEQQRACGTGREQCLANKVYPGCCEKAYTGCVATLPTGEYRVEQERGCVTAHDLCISRFYCE